VIQSGCLALNTDAIRMVYLELVNQELAALLIRICPSADFTAFLVNFSSHLRFWAFPIKTSTWSSELACSSDIDRSCPESGFLWRSQPVTCESLEIRDLRTICPTVPGLASELDDCSMILSTFSLPMALAQCLNTLFSISSVGFKWVKHRKVFVFYRLERALRTFMVYY
jgi:hypothetical protein